MTNDVTNTPEITPADTPETTTGGRIYRPLSDIVETAEGVTLIYWKCLVSPPMTWTLRWKSAF